MELKAPFPYFGGKSSIASDVWERFGDVRNYVEPFFGSGAVLLNRPEPFAGTETVNDLCGFVSNFWRALQADPEAVASFADWPVNENDLHARHVWLLGQRESITARLEGDPDWFDAKVAGWWCWGICCWIGSGWCSGIGPWHAVDGELVNTAEPGKGAWRQLVNLRHAGQGVKRQLVHLGDAGRGVKRQRVHLGNAGQGVKRQRVHLGPGGNGMQTTKVGPALYEWFDRLSDRLRRVRVCCGDWRRVCGPTPTVKQGLTAVFLDPPYADTAGRDSNLYRIDSESVAHDVRVWAIEHGDDPMMRIALCGYEDEHVMPASWECVAWKATGGYSSQAETANGNCHRERIWYSPHCLDPYAVAGPLFAVRPGRT